MVYLILQTLKRKAHQCKEKMKGLEMNPSDNIDGATGKKTTNTASLDSIVKT